MFNVTKMRVASLFFCFLALMLFGAVNQAKADRCSESSEVTVIIRDTDRQFIPDVKFTIYEQVRDVDGEKTIGRSIGSGKIEQYLGSGSATVYPYEETSYYVVKVENPTLTNLDFWFFDAMSLHCGKDTTITLYLSALKISATDTQGQLQKNIRFSIYAQATDPLGNLSVGQELGSFNTGDSGQTVVYVPTRNTSLRTPIDYYALKFRSGNGKEFYRYNLNATDKKMMDIAYVFSDLLITVKEKTSNEVVPNASINFYEQIIDNQGNPTAGKIISSAKANDLGQVYWIYPSGTYFVNFKYSDGRTEDSPNVVINNQQRTALNFYIENDARRSGSCSVRSTLNVSFRDGYGQIVPNRSFTLYEQITNHDDQSVVGNKVTGGKVDTNGLGKVVFNPAPSKRYILVLCDETTKFGCLYFKDIEFECSERLFFERYLTQLDIILRDPNHESVVDQRFKLYARTTDVDGNQIIDEAKGYISFKVPDTGKVSLFLAHKDIYNNPMGYRIVVDNGKMLSANIDLRAGWNGFQYLVYTDRLQYVVIPRPSVVNQQIGKILLQVERNGEAWYLNPADGRRYFLGRPDDAYNVMRSLSIGINNANLNKIPVSLDLMSQSDKDTDGDGLADVLEKGLLTDWQNIDTDGDGYNDYDEIRNGYSPYGAGRQNFDSGFSSKQKGKILLQVEANGEAWYIYPNNAKRYYLSRKQDAFGIMRGLGLGITNDNLAKIPVGLID